MGSMIKLSALQSALLIISAISSARAENAKCIDQSDQREYRKYLAGLIKKISNKSPYMSEQDTCEPSMIGFRCKVVRRGDSMRYCETLLYRFPTYNGPLKAHTFPP